MLCYMHLNHFLFLFYGFVGYGLWVMVYGLWFMGYDLRFPNEIVVCLYVLASL